MSPTSGNQKGVGNIHTHHFIGNYIPDAIFAQQTGHSEKNLKTIIYTLLSIFILPRHLRQFLNLLKTKDINKTRKIHLKDMEASGVDYSVVLLVDYSMSAPISATETLVPYRKILNDTAVSCAKNPFQFFLFHYFDPRFDAMADRVIGKREYKIQRGPYKGKTFKNTTFAIRLLLQAYYEYGIIGIKLYPAHGYHPVPQENLQKEDPDEDNLIQVNHRALNKEEREFVKYNLDFLYQFVHENKLPILYHCGSGGSYNLVVPDHLKGRYVWRYTNPLNFETVVKQIKEKNNSQCNFRICHAHMGGKIHNPEEEDLATKWREDILKLIKDYNGTFYADLSYDISTFLTDEIKDKDKRQQMLDENLKGVRECLENVNYAKFLMFGSDWPMGLPRYQESLYVKAYQDALQGDINLYNNYFSDNMARFLFGEERIIPENHIRFLESIYGKEIPLQPWIMKHELPTGKVVYKIQ